jgi:hypothetical protein
VGCAPRDISLKTVLEKKHAISYTYCVGMYSDNPWMQKCNANVNVNAHSPTPPNAMQCPMQLHSPKEKPPSPEMLNMRPKATLQRRKMPPN